MKYKLRAEQHGPLKNMAVAGGFFFILAGRSVAHGLKKKSDGRPIGATCSKKKCVFIAHKSCASYGLINLIYKQFYENN